MTSLPFAGPKLVCLRRAFDLFAFSVDVFIAGGALIAASNLFVHVREVHIRNCLCRRARIKNCAFPANGTANNRRFNRKPRLFVLNFAVQTQTALSFWSNGRFPFDLPRGSACWDTKLRSLSLDIGSNLKTR